MYWNRAPKHESSQDLVRMHLHLSLPVSARIVCALTTTKIDRAVQSIIRGD
jgi:hypothetical protein